MTIPLLGQALPSIFRTSIDESRKVLLTCKMSWLMPTVMLSCWLGCGGWLDSAGPGSESSRSCWMTSVTAWEFCWLDADVT